jgi:hypothetical protein
MPDVKHIHSEGDSVVSKCPVPERDCRFDQVRWGELTKSMENVEGSVNRIETKLDKQNGRIDALESENDKRSGAVTTLKWIAGIGGVAGVIAFVKAMLV